MEDILDVYHANYSEDYPLIAMDEASKQLLSDEFPAVPMYLPPYSPDLNPIELAFSKFKTLLRKSAERTVDGLWTRIGRLVDQFPINQCKNYFKHCGYMEH